MSPAPNRHTHPGDDSARGVNLLGLSSLFVSANEWCERPRGKTIATDGNTIKNFRIDGTSMYPTFVNEQHIIVGKLPYLQINPGALWSLVPFGKKSEEAPSLLSSTGPVHGEVIAFTYPVDPSREFVKRVIGLPGDTVELDEGQVIRNGEALDEPYVLNNDRRSMKPVTVPEGSYYVLGDNRPVSNDSRSWGFVSRDQIIGRVWFSYWPSDRIEFLHGPW